VNPLTPLRHPRTAFEQLAERPSQRAGLMAVLGSGVVSAGLGLLAVWLSAAPESAVQVAAALPLLFLAYWLIEAFGVDAVAGMVGRSGRRSLMRAVSGFTFPAWVLYAILGVAEALAIRLGGGAGGSTASALQWLTLPILAWFLLLSVHAIRAVYRVSALNAFAFALMPYAMLTAAILVLSIVLTALQG
jgi:Yip1 domain